MGEFVKFLRRQEKIAFWVKFVVIFLAWESETLQIFSLILWTLISQNFAELSNQLWFKQTPK